MTVSKEEYLEALADGLTQAARASVARGAQYRPGETVSTDAESAWKAVAAAMAKVIEKIVDERLAQGSSDVERT